MTEVTMTAEPTNMPTVPEPTLAQQMQANIEQVELRSATVIPLDVRVYEQKIKRTLLNGEEREYIIEHHFLPKKKPGPCKTTVIKQQTKLRAEVKALLHELSTEQLADMKARCESLIAGNQPTSVLSTL